jgi:SAM-dependent methyltransferase
MSKEQERIELHRKEIEFFAKHYGQLLYHPIGWRLRMQRELRSLLREAGAARLGRVLSLGCGDGQFELMLAPYAEQVVGLDLSPEAIALANAAASELGVKNVVFRCMPLEDLEGTETYDAVVCLAIIHHVPPDDVPGLLRGLCQRLTPGGLFYSEDPNRRGVLRWLARLMFKGFYDHYHSPDERELEPTELLEQLRAAGFSDARIGYIDLTLIPGGYALTRGPAALMYFMLWADWLWCHSPFARWASGFFASAKRKE